LKFGIQVVIAGQDFTKEIVGPVREQMRTRLCFRVATPDISTVVIGRRGAENIRVPGRAMMPMGNVQTYLVAKDALAPSDQATGPRMSEAEKAKIGQMVEQFGGRAELDGIQSVYGLNERAARRVRDDWASRGLIEKRAGANNAWFFVQTPWASKVVQTASERPNGVQTALDGQISGG
jgi:DNA segregation ATPase FtsK/SpoIIIE-like protein